MTMTVDLAPILVALVATPGAVAAWEVDDVEDPTLSVFDVSGTPRQLVYVSPTPSERDAVTEALVKAGHPPAFYARATGVVWRALPDVFNVWAERGTGLMVRADVATLADGTAVDRAAIMSVLPFTAEQAVARGVNLQTADASYTIAEHYKHSASFSPDYQDSGAWGDITWVSVLAHQLARWLDVSLATTA